MGLAGIICTGLPAWGFSTDAPIQAPHKILFSDHELCVIAGKRDANAVSSTIVTAQKDSYGEWGWSPKPSAGTVDENIINTFGVDHATITRSQITTTTGRFSRTDHEQVAYITSHLDANTISIAVREPDGTETLNTELSGYVANDTDMDCASGADIDETLDDDGFGYDDLVIARKSTDYSASVVTVLDNTLSKTLGELSFPIPMNTDTGHHMSQTVQVALGDVTGDGKIEICVAVIATPSTSGATESAALDLYVYGYDVETDAENPQLAERSHFQSTLYGEEFYCDLACADINGDAKDEIVLLTVRSLHAYAENASGSLTTLANYRIHEGGSITHASRIYLAPGLFKYNPDEGYTAFRRQIAACWQEATGSPTPYQLRCKIFDFNDVSFSIMRDYRFWENDSHEWVFHMTAGNFQGHGADGESDSKLHQIAVAAIESNASSSSKRMRVRVIDPQTETTLDNTGIALSGSVSTNMAGSVTPRIHAVDTDGDSWMLGYPLLLDISDIVVVENIFQEPPKHIDYLPDDPARPDGPWSIVNVSATDKFNVEFKDEQGQTLSCDQTDTSSILAKLAGGYTVTAGVSLGGVTKGKPESPFAEAEISQKVVFSETHKTDIERLNSSYASRTVSIRSKTTHDDFVKGTHRQVDIWSYLVLGYDNDEEDPDYPYRRVEVSVPGPRIQFSMGGKDISDWYQPLHQNNNILTYPHAGSNISFIPEDLGYFQLSDGTAVESCLNTPTMLNFGSTDQTYALNWSSELGNTYNSSWENCYGNSSEVTASVGFSPKFPIAKNGYIGFKGEIKAEIDWSIESATKQTTVTKNTNASSTGITLSIPSSPGDKAYTFSTAVYNTANTGTLKVAHAVDPYGSTQGASWWLQQYGRKPDPALNLPFRIIQNDDGSYSLNQRDTRMRLRGFIMQYGDADAIIGQDQYPVLNGPPVSGQLIRLTARIYNLGLKHDVDNVTVLFQAVELDDLGYEIGDRIDIGTDEVSLLSYEANEGPSIEEAAVFWDTTGWSTEGTYRFYVTVDPDNSVDELHEWKDAYGAKVVSGNNEGYWPWTGNGIHIMDVKTEPIVQGAANDQNSEESLSLDEYSLAVIVEDEDDTEAITAHGSAKLECNQTYRLRLHIVGNEDQYSFKHVFFTEGPLEEENLIEFRQASVKEGDSYVWADWTPTTPGEVELHAKVMDDDDAYEYVDTIKVTVMSDSDDGSSCFISTLLR